ncbi:MAG TPA: 2OG-Fe(II) oxygenase family protein, partial [Allosphingosinicella sp.]
SLEPGPFQEAFASTGRVQLSPFLKEQCAEALLDHVRGRSDWHLVLNAGAKVFEIDRAGQAAMEAGQRERMEMMVAAAARSGFQYRFESVRVPDEEAARSERGSLLDRFASFMSSEPVLDLLRAITLAQDISFADAQATSYSPGHFLTTHDDAVEGKQRRAAYVLGLTREWRAEWGGLLMFHDPAGDIEQAYLPRMNVLNLFTVPALHSVSLVAPFAAEPRYSVTGWLRAAAPRG